MLPSPSPTIPDVPEVVSYQTLDQILEKQTAIHDRETQDLKTLQDLYKDFKKEHKQRDCEGYINTIGNHLNGYAMCQIVLSLFAKPGYGKSYMINQMVTGFERHDYPLPSISKMGAGVTKTIIDVKYGDKYSLKKVMCTTDEYLLRCKGEGDTDYKSQDPICIDDEESFKSDSLLKFCQRAHAKILQFEKEKKPIEALTVKKLVLEIPSPFLKQYSITLRDMPGYDEKENKKLYQQYIQESMADTNVVLVGSENQRGSFDNGLFEKLWDYGLISSEQRIYPSIVFLVNDKSNPAPTEPLTNTQSILESFVSQVNDLLLGTSDETENKDGVEKRLGLVDSGFENELIAKKLTSHFDQLQFPGKESNQKYIELFVKGLRRVIELNRLDRQDLIVRDIRDIAMLTLSHFVTKFNKKNPTNLMNGTFKKAVGSVTKNMVAHLKGNQPTTKNLVMKDVSCDKPQFLTSFIKCIKDHFLGFLNANDLKLVFTKKQDEFKNRYKELKKKESWVDTSKILFERFQLIVDNLKMETQQKITTFHNFLKTKSPSIELNLSDDFLEDLEEHLNGFDENENYSPNGLVLQIVKKYNELKSEWENYFENQFLPLFENVTFMEGVEKATDLLETYRKKIMDHTDLNVTLETKFITPKRTELGNNSNLLPESTSETVDELKDKKYCGNSDSLIKMEMEKHAKSIVVLIKVGKEQINPNELFLTIDRIAKTVSIEYNPILESKLKYFKEIEPKPLESKRVAPILIISRPRGNDWAPNFLIQDYQLMTLMNVKNIFFIVTESKYVNRYKKYIENKVGTDHEYHFIVVQESSKLGPGVMEKLAMLVCEFFGIQVYHLLHDSVRCFFEYLPDQKIIIHHESVCCRALLFNETVLYDELFTPRFSLQKKRQIMDIITEDVVKQLSDSIVESDHFRQMRSVYDFLHNFSSQREQSLQSVTSNPQTLLDHLECASKFGIDTLPIKERIENVFNERKHIGRVTLWDRHISGSQTKNKLQNLSKPTHQVSNMKSLVNTYYMPSMRGIHPVSDETLWMEPNESERKKTLSDIIKKKSNAALKLTAMERGWRFTEIGLKTQMMLHGVGTFQVFCFSYTEMTTTSLVDYSSPTRDGFDSDEEEYLSDSETVYQEEEIT